MPSPKGKPLSKEKRNIMEFKRCSGILMPISSLPGGYGIGSMGKPARDFVDFLTKAGQTIWQILPVGPTGYADSPYQSCSAFAGNPILSIWICWPPTAC